MRARILPCVVLILVGCGQPDHSLDSVEMTVYSVDPHSARQQDKSKGEWFRGYRVLGKIAIKDSSTKRKIIVGIAQGYKVKPERTLDCFDPRHAVSICENGKTIDHLICFGCGYALKMTNDDTGGMSTFSNAPSEILNKVLKDAGIPIAD
jgi:hypothetical protein